VAAPVLAIDFGTSNSAAAWLDEQGRVHVAAIKENVALLPSVAWYGKTGHVLVGQPARQQLVADPKNTVFGFKRFMGTAWSSPFVHRHKGRFAFDLAEAADGTVGVKVASPNGPNAVKPLEDIAVDILKRLVELASISAGMQFNEAIITVPAHFGYAQRMSIRRSAVRAGLNVKGMVNEPTAAAMYYARKKGNDGTVLVFDLGGGTFDATLMAIVSGVVKVLATGGDAFLGGADFDARIVEHMIRSFHDQHGVDLREDMAATQRLLIAAEAAKIELSRSDEARVRVSCVAVKNDRFLDLELRLTRKELEEMTATLVEKCVGACTDLLKKANIEALAVDEIVFVGGMTRMPAIRKRLADIFVANPSKNVHPDLGVVVGAALLTQGDHSLIDVTSMAIGLAMPGGQNRELVPANTPVPSVKRVTIADNERPAAGQPLAFGVYEAVDVTSLERDLLGAVRVPPEWLAQNPGSLAVEAWLGADLDLTLFLHGSSGNKLQLPLSLVRNKTAPKAEGKEHVDDSKSGGGKLPGFRSLTLEPSTGGKRTDPGTSKRKDATTGDGTSEGSIDASAAESGDGTSEQAQDEPNAPQPGENIGGYELLDVIGKGGMGRVYLAEHVKLGRRVALKMLRKRYKKDSTALERFQAEARAVNQIRHENIIEVTDLFETADGRACYIMEVLEGRSLAELLRSVGVPRLERTVRIAFQVASAMVAVHDAHIIHRDLKPENIFLTSRGSREDFVKLLDFGVAKLVDEEGQSIHDTNAGARIGTLDYMPPEQAVGAAVDHRADIYALGVVLYEMTTGKRPFELSAGASDRALLFAQLEKRPPAPSTLVPVSATGAKRTLPAELDQLILDCLAREPEKRPQTMREVRGRLEAVAEKIAAPAARAAEAEAPTTSSATPAVFIQGPNLFSSMPSSQESGPNGKPLRPPAPPEHSVVTLPQASGRDTGDWRPVIVENSAGVPAMAALNQGLTAPNLTAPNLTAPNLAAPSTTQSAPAVAAQPPMQLPPPLTVRPHASSQTSSQAQSSVTSQPHVSMPAAAAAVIPVNPASFSLNAPAPARGGAPSNAFRRKDEDTSKVMRRPKKRGASPIAVAIIVIVALAIGLGVGFVLFGPNGVLNETHVVGVTSISRISRNANAMDAHS
jgi:molecular chaperone DnaK